MNSPISRNDLTYEQCVSFRKLERIFLNRCRHLGYKEIKTSTIQPLHIFTALGAFSDAKIRRIYSFIDWNGWSGERVALKPDSTTSVVRFYGEYFKKELTNKPPPEKFSYVENHFEWADSTDVEQESDRISERWQCGVENIGSRSFTADIEVIYMACDILKNAGFKDIHLFLSYPAVVRKLIDAFSFDDETRESLVQAIRKGDEKFLDIVRSVPESEVFESLLKLNGRSVNFLKNHMYALSDPIFTKVVSSMQNFIEICEVLDRLGQKYVIDFSLLGDFEYYTGIQFQVLNTSSRKLRTNILCAGGRYDNLIGDMWDLEQPVPAVGYALYGRNIVRHLPTDNDNLQNICIHVRNINHQNVSDAQKLCNKLDRLGFEPKITFTPVPPEQYTDYGLVIEVDHDRFENGFRVDHSQKIGKPLLMKLFGELNNG